MLAGILGRKIGMTQVYDDQGRLLPVTVVQAGPCSGLQVKTARTDGYNALQIGFEDLKPHRATKPQIGHAARAGIRPKRHVREIRLSEEPADISCGQTITVEAFEGVSYVDVTGTTKGKGFAGVMKRHNFKGMPASHGTERKHRCPGSIASHSSNLGTGGKPKKGKRMAGRMGGGRRTTRNHKVVAIDKDNNLLLLQGPLPGAGGGLLFVRKSKTARNRKA